MRDMGSAKAELVCSPYGGGPPVPIFLPVSCKASCDTLALDVPEGTAEPSSPDVDVLPDNEAFDGRVDRVFRASAALRLFGNANVDFLLSPILVASVVGAVVIMAGVLGMGGVEASACSFAVLDSCESEACLSLRRLNRCLLGGCSKVSTPIARSWARS